MSVEWPESRAEAADLDTRNASLLRQRDEAYRRLEAFGKVLSDSVFALEGGNR